MSQDKGRTMIGTTAPVVPRSGSTTHPRPMKNTGPQQPTIVPLSSGPLQAPTYSSPTVGMRPHNLPAPGTGPGPGTGAGFGGGGSDDPEMFIGQELCGYTIRRKLAEGGMGVVYEGIHTKIGRLGAIKVLKLELCRSEDVVERFYQEARAVNSIQHENIVDIYDFGRDPQGRVFFVMEYLEGEPLSARIQRGALTWFEAFPILEQTLRALKAAHDKGYVHRDLKPDNIWLKYVEGRVQVKLLDFGIAKLVGTDSPQEKLTRTGSVIGTPHYMSPEQINGSKDIDHRTDIYALGVITYEMFAGKTPFIGDTLQAIMTGHLFREPPRLADIPATLGVPAPIAEIVDRMLVKDATGRYDSVAEVLADLYDVNRNQWPTHAGTMNRTRPARGATLVAPPAPVAAPPKRKSLGLVVGGGIAVVGLAIGGISIGMSSRDEPKPPVAVVPTTTTPTRPTEPKPPDYDAIRKDAQTLLRASLRETESAVRVQGADALGKIKDQPSVPALAERTEKDDDLEVRGHAAHALGAIGASSTAQLLGKLEAEAPAPLKVWYASALAQLGDKPAAKRLLGYARSKDLAVAFPAGLTLAEVSKPGDQEAIRALRALAAHEADLNKVQPYAGALLLTKLAALRDAASRKVLYGILENPDEGARLAAAEGLAKLGDDAGKQVLQAVFANEASPNRLVAAVAQIALGEYGGQPLITAALGAKEPDTRRLAARALGDINERTSLPALIALTTDKDWTVRIAASAAIVAIVGIDPAVLAQASVDWTKSSLASQDWAVRRAAAGVLADIPEKQAMPLLAAAIADTDPKVRLAAYKSAGKMKSADAASQVVAAVKTESDPAVKEQQVAALGQIGNAVAHDTLAQISEEPGRIGVLAAGSLIAVGDNAGKAKLDAAIAAPQVELRLAAMQAATTANKPLLLSTLKIGVLDRVFSVKFAAAEGLSLQRAESATVVPILNEAASSKDPETIGRAMAALTRFGAKPTSARTPGEMIDSADPALRLAAVPAVRALPASEAAPLLRRLVADSDPDVRHAGVDAIEGVVAQDKEQAIKLYKPLVSDADPFVRSKASGQLSRLVPPPPTNVEPATKPAPVDPPPAPPKDASVPKVQQALDATKAAATEAKPQIDAIAAVSTDLTAAIGVPARDEAATKRVGELATSLGEAATKLETTATNVEAAAKAAADAAGPTPTPEAKKLADEAGVLAQDTRATATDARRKATDLDAKARVYLNEWTGNVDTYLAKASAAIASGNFTEAKLNLDKAAQLIRKSGERNANFDYMSGSLYDQMANRSRDAAEKHRLHQQAKDAYRRFVKVGTGSRVKLVTERLTELDEEDKESPPP